MTDCDPLAECTSWRRAVTGPERRAIAMKPWCGGWGYITVSADQTVWDVPVVRVECRGCAACRFYRIEMAHADIGGDSLGTFYLVMRHPEQTLARQFQRVAEAEEWIRKQVAGRIE